jgi:hypothetical protein
MNGFKPDLRIGVHRFWPDFAIRPHPAIQAAAHAGLLADNGYAKKKQNERERASGHVHLRLAFWKGRESTTVFRKRREIFDQGVRARTAYRDA